MSEQTLFGQVGEGGGDAADRALVVAYEQQGRTLDDLPYTEAFDRLYGQVAGDGGPWAGRNEAEVFRRLHNLRKRGDLPRLGRSAVGARVRLEAEGEAVLTGLVEGEVGALGRRDQLPYTEGFTRVVVAFNGEMGLSLTAHDVWRVVAKLAK